MSIGTDQSSHSAWHRGASLGAARYVHLAASRSSAGRVAPSPNIADADTSLSLHCGASEWDASSVQWAGMNMTCTTVPKYQRISFSSRPPRASRQSSISSQFIDGQTIEAGVGVGVVGGSSRNGSQRVVESSLHVEIYPIQHCTNLLLIHYICKLARRPNRP